MEFDDVRMVQTGHGVDFLEEEFFKEWVLDHFFFGDALDSIKC